jgi:hypothetical protein
MDTIVAKARALRRIILDAEIGWFGAAPLVLVEYHTHTTYSHMPSSCPSLIH